MINLNDFYSLDYEKICENLYNHSKNELIDDLIYFIQSYREDLKMETSPEKSILLSQNSIFYELAIRKLDEVGFDIFLPKRLEVLLN
ncbi:MAG: hypothetical protein KKB62_03145 [Nanoarchaeota archaeon]|nr:hypothetical protein [Nanoarchaeota archaeon]